MAHPQDKPHFAWLDLLRFVAALVVVVGHARASAFVDYGRLAANHHTGIVAVFYALTRLGGEAVIVFFVLSGYLVGGKVIERCGKGVFVPVDYAVDRLSRIWVPLIPALVLSALVSPTHVPMSDWIGNLLGLQHVMSPSLGGNQPLWSLAYEVWFYVLAYAIGRQAMRPTLDVVSLALICAVTMVFSVLSVSFLTCWLVGALLYARPHRMRPAVALPLAALLGVGAVGALQLMSGGVMQQFSGPSMLTGLMEIMLAVATAILCSTLSTLPPLGLSRLSSILAAFSYTLYLTHYPVLTVFERMYQPSAEITPATLGAFAGAVGLCLAVAWLMYLAFEKQTPKVRQALRRLTA